MKIHRTITVLFIVAVVLTAGAFLFLEKDLLSSGPTLPDKKVVILGFDGMDPKLLDRFVQAGKLPNLKALMKLGDYRPLATTIPPLSPVAWSTFITGMDPGGHGVFDFIHREPETLLPYLSTSHTEPPKKKLRLGDWVIPLSAGKVTLLRKGEAFWEILEEHGIPVTVIRVPANFPPVKSKGRQLSGMGTPDLRGTYGMFSFFTDEPPANYKVDSGGEVYQVRVVDHQVKGKLFGPGNSFRIGTPQSSVDFKVFLDPVNPVAKIAVQNHEVLLKEKEWSPWVQISFEMVPYLQRVGGIVRFYLKEVRPHFKLYASPVNIDPSAPALPISTPESYVQELFEEIGPFYTQGMPYDTKALSPSVLGDGDFLGQGRIILDEQLRMFDYEWSRFRSGLFFFYLGRVDQLSHMFWRTMDSRHPAYDPSGSYRGVIEKTYQDMDNVVGRMLQRLDENTLLIVMSDHGFAPFYRAFNLNTWLYKEGYLKLRDVPAAGEAEFFANVEWSQSKAYGLGLNGLYINTSGREPRGSVRRGAERDALLDEIVAKLEKVRDPKTGGQVIRRLYRPEDIYHGSEREQAPDLIVGYARGYRVSWESILGKIPSELFRDNKEKWSGDHAMAAELVPGVLLANKKIKSSYPALHDLAPTVLQEFGISKREGMIGSSLF